MRSELFEEAWKQNRHVWESTKCLAQAMYLAGEKHQQPKVDELKLQVAEMKSRLNDAYTDGQSAMYIARQSKVDELQKQKSLQELEINQIAHANQQWQLKCVELQKRVDKAIRLLVEAELYQSEPNIDLAVQALKGGEA